jgi:hypothetical protein
LFVEDVDRVVAFVSVSTPVVFIPVVMSVELSTPVELSRFVVEFVSDFSVDLLSSAEKLDLVNPKITADDTMHPAINK